MLRRIPFHTSLFISLNLSANPGKSRYAAAKGIIRKTDGIRAVGGSISGWNQLICGCHFIPDDSRELQKAVFSQRFHFRPIHYIGPGYDFYRRVRLAVSVEYSLFINTAVKGICHIRNCICRIRTSGNPPSIGSCRRNGSGIHQRN